MGFFFLQLSVVPLLYLSRIQSNMVGKVFSGLVHFPCFMFGVFYLVPCTGKITEARDVDGGVHCRWSMMSCIHNTLTKEVNSTGTLGMVWGFRVCAESIDVLWSCI